MTTLDWSAWNQLSLDHRDTSLPWSQWPVDHPIEWLAQPNVGQACRQCHPARQRCDTLECNPGYGLVESASSTGTSTQHSNLDTIWQSSPAASIDWTNGFHWTPMLPLHACECSVGPSSSARHKWCCLWGRSDWSHDRPSLGFACGACTDLQTMWILVEHPWSWVQAVHWEGHSNWYQMQIAPYRFCDAHLDSLDQLLLHMMTCAEHHLELSWKMLEDLLGLDHSSSTYQLLEGDAIDVVDGACCSCGNALWRTCLLGGPCWAGWGRGCLRVAWLTTSGTGFGSTSTSWTSGRARMDEVPLGSGTWGTDGWSLKPRLSNSRFHSSMLLTSSWLCLSASSRASRFHAYRLSA